MKKIIAIALTVCTLASLLCLSVFAEKRDMADGIRGVLHDPLPLAASADELIGKAYIELFLAIAALVASIVSVILLLSSNRKKKADKHTKKDKK